MSLGSDHLLCLSLGPGSPPSALSLHALFCGVEPFRPGKDLRREHMSGYGSVSGELSAPLPLCFPPLLGAQLSTKDRCDQVSGAEPPILLGVRKEKVRRPPLGHRPGLPGGGGSSGSPPPSAGDWAPHPWTWREGNSQGRRQARSAVPQQLTRSSQKTGRGAAISTRHLSGR